MAASRELDELEVPLPPSLHRFARSARAALIGPPGAPVLVLLGGISANRHPCLRPDGQPGWWAGLAGPGGAADPSRCRIAGLEFISDDEGATAPATQDQALALACALDLLEIGQAHAIVGASYGGMIALAFAALFPHRVDRLVVVSADGSPHPSATAARELQRRVVQLGLEQGRGEEALAIARGMAMLTYRSPEEFGQRFAGGIPGQETLACSEPGAYLRARGAAFGSVMSPQRFLSLSASIDRHRVDSAAIRAPTLLIGARSDQLVPPSQMEALAAQLGGPADLHLLPSLYGHDMFLKEAPKLSALARPFLAQ